LLLREAAAFFAWICLTKLLSLDLTFLTGVPAFEVLAFCVSFLIMGTTFSLVGNFGKFKETDDLVKRLLAFCPA
jgi:hypothetical protein